VGLRWIAQQGRRRASPCRNSPRACACPTRRCPRPPKHGESSLLLRLRSRGAPFERNLLETAFRKLDHLHHPHRLSVIPSARLHRPQEVLTGVDERPCVAAAAVRSVGVAALAVHRMRCPAPGGEGTGAVDREPPIRARALVALGGDEIPQAVTAVQHAVGAVDAFEQARGAAPASGHLDACVKIDTPAVTRLRQHEQCAAVAEDERKRRVAREIEHPRGRVQRKLAVGTRRGDVAAAGGIVKFFEKNPRRIAVGDDERIGVIRSERTAHGASAAARDVHEVQLIVLFGEARHRVEHAHAGSSGDDCEPGGLTRAACIRLQTARRQRALRNQGSRCRSRFAV
jgi:hypothetical protein